MIAAAATHKLNNKSLLKAQIIFTTHSFTYALLQELCEYIVAYNHNLTFYLRLVDLFWKTMRESKWNL